MWTLCTVLLQVAMPITAIAVDGHIIANRLNRIVWIAVIQTSFTTTLHTDATLER